MEKTKDLFAEIYSYETLMEGYSYAIRSLSGKWRETGTHHSAGDADEVIINVQNHLIHKSYEPGNPLYDAIVEYALHKVLSAHMKQNQAQTKDEGVLWLIGVLGLNSMNITDFDML